MGIRREFAHVFCPLLRSGNQHTLFPFHLLKMQELEFKMKLYFKLSLLLLS